MVTNQDRAQFLITFGYLGHFFHGVQPQKNVPTVGESLFQLICSAAQTPPKALQFSARTDKGVHALMNAATCWFRQPFDEALFLQNLKQMKTPGLLAVHARPVPRFVHARGSAKGKHYRYVVEDNCVDFSKNPFVWAISPALDVFSMQKAAHFLVGEHDFTSFRAAGCSAKTVIKNLQTVTVTRVGISNQIHIDIIGDAFLRQMIRNIVGVLVEIGAGFRKAEDIIPILDAKNRRNAGICAPPTGLMLMEVKLNWPPS